MIFLKIFEIKIIIYKNIIMNYLIIFIIIIIFLILLSIVFYFNKLNNSSEVLIENMYIFTSQEIKIITNLTKINNINIFAICVEEGDVFMLVDKNILFEKIMNENDIDFIIQRTFVIKNVLAQSGVLNNILNIINTPVETIFLSENDGVVVKPQSIQETDFDNLKKFYGK